MDRKLEIGLPVKINGIYVYDNGDFYESLYYKIISGHSLSEFAELNPILLDGIVIDKGNFVKAKNGVLYVFRSFYRRNSENDNLNYKFLTAALSQYTWYLVEFHKPLSGLMPEVIKQEYYCDVKLDVKRFRESQLKKLI
jgi:hypothetical protein